MNYLDITNDKLKQTRETIKRAEKALEKLREEEQELEEVIQTLLQMTRYKGVEEDVSREDMEPSNA